MSYCSLDKDLIGSNKCHVYFKYLSLISKVTQCFALSYNSTTFRARLPLLQEEKKQDRCEDHFRVVNDAVSKIRYQYADVVRRLSLLWDEIRLTWMCASIEYSSFLRSSLISLGKGNHLLSTVLKFKSFVSRWRPGRTKTRRKRTRLLGLTSWLELWASSRTLGFINWIYDIPVSPLVLNLTWLNTLRSEHEEDVAS